MLTGTQSPASTALRTITRMGSSFGRAIGWTYLERMVKKYLKPIVFWAIILFAFASSYSRADTFTISWTPPAAYTDGTPLFEQDLDFYTVYINNEPIVNLQVIVGTWTADITITQPGTHDLTMTVTDYNGQESAQSNMVNFTVGPRTPGAVTITGVVAVP